MTIVKLEPIDEESNLSRSLLLGHNRGKHKSLMQKIRSYNERETRDLTWKTLAGKTTGVKLQRSLYVENVHNGELQGDDLELAVLATGGGNTQRRRPLLSLTLSLSLSLSRLLSTFTLLEWKNKKMRSNSKTVCPKSYLYSYDFWAIYKYSLEGSWQTYSQICPRIRISLRVHPSSGSEAGVFIIRFRYRVLFIRVFIPDSRTSDHPIRRDRNPNTNKMCGHGCSTREPHSM